MTLDLIEHLLRRIYAVTSAYKRRALERRMDRDPVVAQYRAELDVIKADMIASLLRQAERNLSREEFLDLRKQYGGDSGAPAEKYSGDDTERR